MQSRDHRGRYTTDSYCHCLALGVFSPLRCRRYHRSSSIYCTSVVWFSGCVGNAELSSRANVFKPNYGVFRQWGKNCCSQWSGKWRRAVVVRLISMPWIATLCESAVSCRVLLGTSLVHHCLQVGGFHLAILCRVCCVVVNVEWEVVC
jgi:hypothetical protein